MDLVIFLIRCFFLNIYYWIWFFLKSKCKNMENIYFNFCFKFYIDCKKDKAQKYEWRIGLC